MNGKKLTSGYGTDSTHLQQIAMEHWKAAHFAFKINKLRNGFSKKPGLYTNHRATPVFESAAGAQQNPHYFIPPGFHCWTWRGIDLCISANIK